MDAGEQRALAPFGLACSGSERALQREAFGRELRHRHLDLGAWQRERFRYRTDRRGAETLESATHDLDQRFLALPFARGEFFGRLDRR